MAITINGSGTITGVSAGGLPDGCVDADTLASGVGGKVLQVVSTTKTDIFSLTGTTTFTDITGLSVSITPSSTSSKILVFGNVYTSISVISNTVATRLVRGSTAIGGGTPEGNRQSAIAGTRGFTDSYFNHGFNYLDSPSTTSATTYKIQMIARTGATGYVNRTGTNENDAQAYSVRPSSTITVMEIAG